MATRTAASRRWPARRRWRRAGPAGAGKRRGRARDTRREPFGSVSGQARNLTGRQGDQCVRGGEPAGPAHSGPAAGTVPSVGRSSSGAGAPSFRSRPPTGTLPGGSDRSFRNGLIGGVIGGLVGGAAVRLALTHLVPPASEAELPALQAKVERLESSGQALAQLGGRAQSLEQAAATPQQSEAGPASPRSRSASAGSSAASAPTLPAKRRSRPSRISGRIWRRSRSSLPGLPPMSLRRERRPGRRRGGGRGAAIPLERARGSPAPGQRHRRAGRAAR